MDYDRLKAHYVGDEKGREVVKLSFGIDVLNTSLLANKRIVLHDKTISKYEWKKFVAKLIEKLEITINNTVKSDMLHIEQMKYLLKIIRESCKDFYKYQPEILAGLIRLSFMLVGEVPDLKGKSRHRNQYVANLYRSIKYEQSNFQKSMLLLQYARTINKFKEFDIEFTRIACDGNKFVDWVKRKYPAIYCKLF